LTRNSHRTLAVFLATTWLTGCSRAPAFDVLGSFFPAWLLCLVVGVLLSFAARWLISRLGIVIEVPVLTQPHCAVRLRAVARLLSLARKTLVNPQTGKVVGRFLSGAIVAGAIAAGLVVIHDQNRYPRTDDCEIVANFIGIAPQVEGPILHLNVRDNQSVRQGDLLFEIDDRPFRYALERAISEQAALEGQIVDETRRIAAQVSGVSVADANVQATTADVARWISAIRSVAYSRTDHFRSAGGANTISGGAIVDHKAPRERLCLPVQTVNEHGFSSQPSWPDSHLIKSFFTTFVN
jgi:hypothetical protein